MPDTMLTKHPTNNPNENLEVGELYVITREGKPIPYDDERIRNAIMQAFLATAKEQGDASHSSRIHTLVEQLTRDITNTYKRRNPHGAVIHLEDIQDQVELTLMRAGEREVAAAYVIYRNERRKAREAAQPQVKPIIHVTQSDGSKTPLDLNFITKRIEEACADLENVDPALIRKEFERNLYDGIPASNLNEALVMSARTLVEKEPNYTYVSARLLFNELREEAFTFLGLKTPASTNDMQKQFVDYFKAYIKKGIELKRLNPELARFDLDTIGAALNAKRDGLFTFLGLQTLYDRYLIHNEGIRFELPQALFMRVAMGLALEEKNREERAIAFYNLLSSFEYMSSTPTLFNSGTLRPQLSSCFLTTVPDDLDGIYSAIKDNALLSKYAGGLGNDWTPVRAMNAYIEGTNGRSLGVVPFLNVANASAVAVNQGGKRKGAVVAYLEIWHKDIEEFLELRKNTGDDRRRTHDMNTAIWINDLFLQRVINNEDWTLFSPDEVPDLHDLFGKDFEKAYVAYEAKAKAGKIKNFKTLPATTLWRRALGMLYETGHPWITFKDPCNLRSPQQHAGVVHSSNLCTEITLNTSRDEIAVCNLGSINLPAHIENGQLNLKKLEQTITVAMRMLDNVININYYSVPQAKNSNLKHRPVGLGIMGFQDALHQLRLPYASKEAVEFADRSMEAISYYAISASSDLAKERGTYPSFEGSLWSQGILPIDSIELLRKARSNDYLQQDIHTTLDWSSLRERVKKQGMRNSNTMAIAPTATISNICGVSQSIEPTYQNLFVKSNLSGEFTVVNPYLVHDLKRLNLWDDVMVNDLKYFNGSVQPITRIPDSLKTLYATAFEVEPHWLIEAASRRQKWIDQGQSLNLYMAEPSGKKLDAMYRHAWLMGLKTTYYLRSLGATSTEKSTITDRVLNAVAVTTLADAPKACAIDDPDCEACQ